MEERTYTSSECSRLTGATLRMLQFWDETNLLVPEIVGHARRYTQGQVLSVRVFRWLRDAGVTIAMIRRMKLKNLCDDYRVMVVSLTGRTPQWSLWMKDAEVIKAATGKPFPVVVVPLQRLRELIGEKARKRAA